MNSRICSLALCLIVAYAFALGSGCKNRQQAIDNGSNELASSQNTPANDSSVSGNLIGLSTPNGRTAREFLDLWFNQHKPEEAFDKYVSHENYMNHTTTTDVVQTFESEKAAEAKMTSNSMHFEIQQIIAQGDLVAVHIFATGGGTKNGDELVEFLRFRDGKVVDHWDFHVPLQDKSAVFTKMNRWDNAGQLTK